MLCSQEPLDSGEEITCRVVLWAVQDVLSMWVCDGPWLMALGTCPCPQTGLRASPIGLLHQPPLPSAQTHTKLHLTGIQ